MCITQKILNAVDEVVAYPAGKAEFELLYELEKRGITSESDIFVAKCVLCQKREEFTALHVHTGPSSRMNRTWIQ
jgi:hypothetical protein